MVPRTPALCIKGPFEGGGNALELGLLPAETRLLGWSRAARSACQSSPWGPVTGKEDTPTWQGPIRTENAATQSLFVNTRNPFSGGAIRTKPEQDNFRAAACRPV